MTTAGAGRPVPFLDLGREYEAVAEELESAVLAVMRAQQYVLGPAAEAFESDVAGFIGAGYALGVGSGSDAIGLALAALDVGPGDEVVTTPLSFFSTASSIARLGATPVFADIDPGDYLLDPRRAAEVISERTRALLPVHLYGQCFDFHAFDAIARPAGVAIVEDAAQAIGARRAGISAGTFGDLGCFSFYPTKNLSALGEAGLVTTTDERLAQRVARLRNHGSPRRYEHVEVGWNARLDGMQAAALSVKLRYIGAWNDRRRALAARYDEVLGGLDLDGELTLPVVHPDSEHVFHQYVVRADRRDALRAHLAERGLGTEVYYPSPLHLQPCFESLGHGPGDFPVAERACEEVLALPVYAYLTEEEQDRIVAAIGSFYRGE